MLQQQKRFPAADTPGVTRYDLLNTISPYSVSDLHVPDDFDRHWVDNVVTTTDKFDIWKDTAPAWYLHLAGTPRSGKTTCLAALARKLQQVREPLQREEVAVVDLFLDSHDFEDRQGFPHVSSLEVILRAILRRLIEHLLPTLDAASTTKALDLNAMPRQLLDSLSSLDDKFKGPKLDIADLRRSIEAAAQCFSKTYVLVDDIHNIPGLSGEDIFLELRSLHISSVMFTGLPLNRICGVDMEKMTCDGGCKQPSTLWAECEVHNRFYCPQCWETKPKCCTNMMPVLPVVELPLVANVQQYVGDALSQSKTPLEAQHRLNVSTDIIKNSQGSLPLARLALDDFLQTPNSEDVGKTRDRLSVPTNRFFNLALYRVSSQRCQADIDLGMATLAFVSLTDSEDSRALGFHALVSILCQVRDQTGKGRLYGEPLNRERISRVTQGWLNIDVARSSVLDTPIRLFHEQAKIYLNEERSEFHTTVLGDGPRDLALICLESLSAAAPEFQEFQYHAKDVLDDHQKRALSRYALENWGRHFKQYSSETTRLAACNFLNQYQKSLVLKRYYRKTTSDRSPFARTAVGHPMHVLAYHGLHELVDRIAHNPDDLNVVDATTGLTPAMVACIADSAAFVRLLLGGERPPECLSNDRASLRADFSQQCRKGNTALWYAIQAARIKTVRHILHCRGATLVNLQDKQGKTPLMLAIEQNDDKHKYDDMIRLLLDCNGLKLDTTDNFGKTALHTAAMRAHPSILQMILQRAAGKRIINTMEHNRMKRTPLMVLLSDNDQWDDMIEAIKIFIKYGADTTLSDAKGRTVLHYTASSNDFSGVLPEILKTKIDVRVRDRQGCSAIQVARAYGTQKEDQTRKIVEMLLAQQTLSERNDGLDKAIDASREQEKAKHISRTGSMPSPAPLEDQIIPLVVILGHTELHTAVRNASIDAVQGLLSRTAESKIDPNGKTIDGETALHLAIQALAVAGTEGDEDRCEALETIIRILLERTDLSAENDLNERVIDSTIRLIYDRHEVVLDIIEATLTKYYVAVRSVRMSEHQQYLRAALMGQRPRSPELIEVLLEGGASVYEKLRDNDRIFKLPREIAEEHNLGKDVVDMLVKWEDAVDSI